MSAFWPLIALASIILAFLFEIYTARKEKKMREELKLAAPEIGFFARFLLFTSLAALLLGFILLSFYQEWSVPKDGVAVVFNAQGLSPSEQDLSQEKGALQELIEGLQGVSLSLYEYHNGSLSCLVPPTIDRIYFSLMADGIQPEPGELLSLETIQKEVLSNEQNTHPWIVVISSQQPVKTPYQALDGVSILVPHLPSVTMQSFDHGIKRSDSSFDALSTRITSRILVSQQISHLGVLEKLLLIVTTIGAWLLYLQWRKRIPPIFWISIFCTLSCLEANEGADSLQNYRVHQIINMAEDQDFAEAEQHLREWLSSITDPGARLRMVYDLALISYLKNDEQASLAWLESEPASNVDKEFAQSRETLLFLNLIRLVEKEEPGDLWRARLLKTLKTSKDLPQNLRAQAETILLLPEISVSEEEEKLKTLLLYTQSMSDAYPEDMEAESAFVDFFLKTQNEVEQGVKTLFSDKGVRLFKDACAQAKSDPFFLYRYALWYMLSKKLSSIEAIQFLLDEGLEFSTANLFFPEREVLFKKNLIDIKNLLRSKAKIPTQTDPVIASAAWYVQARLWEFLREKNEEKISELVILLHGELENLPPLLIQGLFAKECIKGLSLSSNWYDEKEPLQTLFWKAFLEWYERNPTDALGSLLDWTEKNEQVWTPFLTRFFTEKMKYLPITLEKNIEAYNLILLGRLVQIELTPCSLQQEGVLYLTRIIRLYKECVSQVQNIKSTTLDTLRVIFQEQDKMAKKLYALSVFKDDYTKRTNFENLIQEWTKITFALIERLQYAYALRLPKLREEIEQSLFVLIQIRQLFEEKAAPFVEKLTPTPAVPQEKHFSIREEEAVRLYQEMDRMDRMLYGEK